VTYDESKIVRDEAAGTKRPYFTGRPLLGFFIAPLLPAMVFLVVSLSRSTGPETHLLFPFLLGLAYLVATILGLPVLGALRFLGNRSVMVYCLAGLCLGLLIAHFYLSYYSNNAVAVAGPGYEDTYWDNYNFSPGFFGFCGLVGAATTALFWWIAFKAKPQKREQEQALHQHTHLQEKGP